MKKLKRVMLIAMLGALLLASILGCASVSIAKTDGTEVKYSRLGNQKIGMVKITDPNGYSVTIIGQEAMNDEFIKQLSEGIAAGIVAGFKGGI